MQPLDNYSLVGIHEALRQCDSLELELRSSLDVRHVRALKESIQRNNHITTVKFHLHPPWDDVGSQAIVAELVAAVAPLPNLFEFVVVGDFAPIAAITRLLQRATQLETLKLHQFRNLRSCHPPILVDFCRALQCHKALKYLAFKPRIDNTPCEPHESTLLPMLLEALAETSALREVDIETNVSCLSGPPLVKVCNSTTLFRLELRPKDGVGIDGLQALARNTSIQELLVSSELSERRSSAVSLLLAANTTLNKLTVILPETGVADEDHVHHFVQTIADALRTNTTLSDLHIPIGKHHPSPAVLQTFVDIFQDNYTLQTLEVFHDMPKVQRANYEDIEKMPEGIAKSALLLGKKIIFYTLLNRSGRGQLLSGGPGRGQWVDKLVEFNYSLDHLYFFLRTNPALCSEMEREISEPLPMNLRKRGRLQG